MLKNIVEFGLEWGAYRERTSSIICLPLVCQRAVVELINARLRQSLSVHEMPATAQLFEKSNFRPFRFFGGSSMSSRNVLRGGAQGK